MRTCRKCARALPVSEFSEIPRRFVCRRCRSSFARKKRLHAELADGSRRSWFALFFRLLAVSAR